MSPIRLKDLKPMQDFRLYTRLSQQQVLQRVYHQTEKRGRLSLPPFTRPMIKVFEGTVSQHGFELDWHDQWQRSRLSIEASLHTLPNATAIEMRMITGRPGGYVLVGVWFALATLFSVFITNQEGLFPFGLILVPVAGIAVYAAAVGIFKMRCRWMLQHFEELFEAKRA